MSGSQLAIKNRIRSIESTMKITKAMQLVAASKYQRQKERMSKNKEYAIELKELLDSILANIDNSDHPYLKNREDDHPCTIIYTSDMGLCGSYNQNVLRYAEEHLRKEDPLVLIGTSLYRQLKEDGFSLQQEEAIPAEKLSFSRLKEVMNTGMHLFLENKAGRVQVMYTKFVNTMTFVPATDVLLPCETVETEEEKTLVETLFEPSAEEILMELIPMMVQDSAYAHYLESTTAEQGSRRMAMKTATDNATDLAEALQLEYNKARQASITQEITEIVGGSEAL